MFQNLSNGCYAYFLNDIKDDLAKQETLDVLSFMVVLMEESPIVSFAAWCAMTSIIMGVTGFSYRSYLRRKKHEKSPS